MSVPFPSTSTTEPGWWVPSAVTEPADHTPGHQVVRESEKWGRFPVEVVRVEPRPTPRSAGPARPRQLLETLSRHPPCSATTLAAQVPVSRQAVVKHLQVLRDSQLVTSHRAGREVLFEIRPGQLAATWTERLQLLRQQAEQESGDASAGSD